MEGPARQGPRGIPCSPSAFVLVAAPRRCLRTSCPRSVTVVVSHCYLPPPCHQLAHPRRPGARGKRGLPCPCRPRSSAVSSLPWWLSWRSSGCGQWWSHRQSSSEQTLTPVRLWHCRAEISPTQVSPPSADPYTETQTPTCASTATGVWLDATALRSASSVSSMRGTADVREGNTIDS